MKEIRVISDKEYRKRLKGEIAAGIIELIFLGYLAETFFKNF